jgi:hypothetical protein
MDHQQHENTEQPKCEWVTPQVKKMVAGSAENNPGSGTDGLGRAS